MKVLVIGRTGQLATALMAASGFCSSGIELHFAGRPQLDITQPDTIRACLRNLQPDIVVNTAAYTAVDRAEEEPQAAFAVNAEGAGLVAEECRRLDLPLIHLSTDYVFDGCKGVPYVEGDAPAPLNAYGRSKLAGEEAVRQTWTKHLILRTSWVYGPYGRNFVKTMLRLAETRAVLRVVDDQWGTPTSASHLAQAILQLLAILADKREQGNFWGTYHMAGKGQTTWCRLAREAMACARRAGGIAATIKAITTHDHPALAERPRNSSLECSKLKQVFGIQLPAWQQGVAQCVDQIIDNKGVQQ